jgi:hypothetical protein
MSTTAIIVLMTIVAVVSDERQPKPRVDQMVDVVNLSQVLVDGHRELYEEIVAENEPVSRDK